MKIKIQKCGNEQVVQLSNCTYSKFGLQGNDFASVKTEGSKMILKKKVESKHITLRERLTGFSGDYKAEEWNIGEEVGMERQ